jgi:hypothetical protein
MKIKTFTWVVVVGSVAVFVGGNAFAGKAVSADVIKKELKSVPAPELGAKAAQLVSNAGENVRQTTAEAVISTAIGFRPVTAVSVVSAIARENPEVAPAVAARAASLVPKQSAAIASAAAGAAPAQAGKIVFAVCQAVPTKYCAVATAVAQAVPYAGKEIIAAVTSALPSLKPFVDRADSSSTGQSKSVATIMAQTESLVAYAAPLAGSSPEKIVTSSASSPKPLAFLPTSDGLGYVPLPPPTVGPPYTPAGGPPTELSNSETGEIPVGGVRYSGP